MAIDLAEDAAVDAPEEQESEQESSAWAGVRLNARKLKVVALLLIVMGVQMTVGYMLLPEPAVSSMKQGGDLLEGSVDEPVPKSINTVEVPLGSYNPTNSRGHASAVIHVSFELTAIVASNNAQPLQAAFQNTHGARIQAAVVRVIRSSNLEDLNDPDLNVIKRKIREEINKVLPKTYVNEVVLKTWHVMMQ